MSVPRKVAFASLGCPKATVDSEQIISRLRAEGYQISASYEEAELVIVNTCGFIDAAVEESLDTIGEAMAENGKVVVTGCLGAREETILQAYPDVLAVSGPQAYESVMQSVHEHIPQPHDAYSSLLPPGGIKLTPRHYAYIKIAEGCNHSCTFCIIPQMRGKLKSRSMGEVLSEAEALIEAGVRELLIVSQDTGAYGLDSRYATGFHAGRPLKQNILSLAQELGKLPAWVRLHYLYPYPHIDALIPLMADDLILPYLDMPFQHASLSVLKNMRRPAASEKVLQRLQQWRQLCPQLTVRSTFITGFPGESEADFEQLLDFIQQAQLDRVGCFTYSAVEGAAANDLPGAVPESVKQERQQALMQLQAQISRDKLRAKVGQKMIVLVDEAGSENIIARSSADAPEIDGRVLISAEWDLQPGDFVEVEISGSTEHDLMAEPLQ
ncbi:MAG: 30S ribosomal protein S12 methylthiotransferase RimO [gamma proteobacterium symbiont of Bathyaustriella thionipta]|nr:30S ribosomal protein S12 methylthiotransferase RimO [gamma proteobacterium symbiont of Bathyaustriella thionipta]